MPTWSPQQDDALLKVKAWWDEGPTRRQIFYLFGFAGTGKTTLAREIEEMVGGGVVYATFTGKAAQVLRNKGCENATTIHSLIYRVLEKSRSALDGLEQALLEARDSRHIEEIKEKIKLEKKNLANPSFNLGFGSAVREANMIIIDECSMVDTAMAVDLLSFKKPILVLGDPAQLPPIMGGGYFTENVKPDIMLTEIHRQARDNPIIELATRVREGYGLQTGSYGESRVLHASDLQRGEAMLFDQVLVGKNVTRRKLIHRFREAKSLFQPFPMIGEKLICLRNNHDKGLLNGSLWEAVDTVPSSEDDRFLITVRSLDGSNEDVNTRCWKFPFLGEEATMPWWERTEADELEFGYAITVHKSQGSAFPSVLLVDEWRHADSRQRWLYTGITRASEKITVVKS
jgi:exodeoxyribonuclease-5